MVGRSADSGAKTKVARETQVDLTKQMKAAVEDTNEDNSGDVGSNNQEKTVVVVLNQSGTSESKTDDGVDDAKRERRHEEPTPFVHFANLIHMGPASVRDGDKGVCKEMEHLVKGRDRGKHWDIALAVDCYKDIPHNDHSNLDYQRNVL